MKKYFLIITVIIFMLLLLFIPQLGKEGALAGIELCIYSVIPALFPYIILTNYLISSNLCDTLCSFFEPILGKILRISKYGCFVVIMGLICGYPMGAKLLGELTESKKISKKESCYLITFCNNCSISFIINYIYLSCAGTSINLTHMLLLIYLPIFISAIINRFLFKFQYKEYKQNNIIPNINPIFSAVKTISTLCGYVFIFTIIAYYVKELLPISKNILYPLLCFIEMTSGTAILSTIILPNYILILCMVVIFGGLSIIFQSFALIPNFLKKYYLLGKLEQIVILLILYPIIV